MSCTLRVEVESWWAGVIRVACHAPGCERRCHTQALSVTVTQHLVRGTKTMGRKGVGNAGPYIE